MPTPDLTAAPIPTTALRGPAVPAPATAMPDVAAGPQAFAAMLTALLPPAAGVPVSPAATATPSDPKTVTGAAETGRGAKAKLGRKDEGAVLMPLPLALPAPMPPAPPPTAVSLNPRAPSAGSPGVAAIPTKPRESVPLGIVQVATPKASELPTAPSVVSGPAANRPDAPPGAAAHEKLTPLGPTAIDLAGVHVPLHAQGPDAVAPVKSATPSIASSPAEQLAPVLVSVAKDAAGGGHIALHLRPPALGDLQITIERTPNAPTQVRIEAERPETLALLQRDTPHLQRALDQAGIARDSMTVTFHAAPAVSAAPSAQDAGQMSRQFLGTGQPHQGFADGRPRHAPALDGDAAGPSTPVATDPATPRISIRSGIDITA